MLNAPTSFYEETPWQWLSRRRLQIFVQDTLVTFNRRRSSSTSNHKSSAATKLSNLIFHRHHYVFSHKNAWELYQKHNKYHEKRKARFVHLKNVFISFNDNNAADQFDKQNRNSIGDIF